MPRLFPALAVAALPLTWAAAPALAAPDDFAPDTALQTTAAIATAADLDALEAEALRRAPSLAAARAEVAARVAAERAAGSLPDPMVEAMLQNIGFEWTVGDEDMSMVGAQLRQELPHRAKRDAERSVARALTAAAAVELEHLERQVVQDVRVAWAELYALDRELDTLAAARELVDLLEATARGRYAAGESEAAALLRAQLERTRVDERIADLRAERAVAVVELARWLGRPVDSPIPAVTSLPQVRFDSALAAIAAVGSAEVARRGAAVGVATAELEARRAAVEIDIAPSAGLGWRGDLDPVLLLGVGVSLPLRKKERQLPLIEAAEQELAARQAELADARLAAAAEARALGVAFDNADEQLRRYRDGILPQTEAAFDAARASYLAARIGFSEVLEAFVVWLDARAAVARREADRFTAWAGLSHLTEGHGHAAGDSP
jgi:cobalt-zinc-cadmium efflux system outer membrane protein